jgi:threonine/homoserine/homoserine lactone efflux protein
MHSIDNPGGFIVAILIFQMIPGPGSLNILRATARHGTRAGFAAMTGTLLGGLLCMLAAASGLEAVFRGQPQALQALQVGGSLYLAWLGWRLLAAQATARGPGGDVAPSLFLHLRQALVVSLTNPKVLLFYFALLPLFLRAPVTAESLAAMVVCVSGVSFVYQSMLVLAGRAAAERLSRLPGAREAAQRLAGVLLVGFAVKLMMS